MDIEEGHKKLSDKAAEIANRKVQEAKILPPGVQGNVFVETTLDSNRGGLSITFNEALVHTHPELGRQLKEIGHEAMHEALIEEQELFVGLILGEARSGRNYFRVFKDPGDQMEMF